MICLLLIGIISSKTILIVDFRRHGKREYVYQKMDHYFTEEGFTSSY